MSNLQDAVDKFRGFLEKEGGGKVVVLYSCVSDDEVTYGFSSNGILDALGSLEIIKTSILRDNLGDSVE